MNGQGVAQDPVEAVKWFRKAAEQGEVNSQRNLGLCLLGGEGAKKDPAAAAVWFTNAAESGDAEA
jgi:TPR repeat protein